MFHSETPVAIMLALKTVWGIREVCGGRRGERCRERSARCLGPIHPEKTAGTPHLVAAIHHDRVVNGGAGEPVVPRRLAVVKIRPSIPRQVETVPPQVHVQLIGLERTSRVAPRPHQGPGVFSAETVIARTGGNRVSRLALRRSFELP